MKQINFQSLEMLNNKAKYPDIFAKIWFIFIQKYFICTHIYNTFHTQKASTKPPCNITKNKKRIFVPLATNIQTPPMDIYPNIPQKYSYRTKDIYLTKLTNIRNQILATPKPHRPNINTLSTQQSNTHNIYHRNKPTQYYY